jgi:hypothetical protein
MSDFTGIIVGGTFAYAFTRTIFDSKTDPRKRRSVENHSSVRCQTLKRPYPRRARPHRAGGILQLSLRV